MKRTLVALVALAACGGSGTSQPSDAGTQVLPANCQRLDPSTDQYVACTGAFLKGEAAKICPTGYTLTVGAMPAILRQTCDVTLTATRPDTFYAVDVGSWSDPAAPFSKTSCTSVAGYLPGLMGCGGEQNATAFSGQGAAACQSWPHAIVCPRSSGWTCPDGTLKTASNTNVDHGVICSR